MTAKRPNRRLYNHPIAPKKSFCVTNLSIRNKFIISSICDPKFFTRTKTRPHLQKRKKYANSVSACVISIVTHINYNPRKRKTTKLSYDKTEKQHDGFSVLSYMADNISLGLSTSIYPTTQRFSRATKRGKRMLFSMCICSKSPSINSSRSSSISR